MQSKTPVEIADQYSRKRAAGVAAAAIVFLAIQVLARPFFIAGSETAHHVQIDLWAVTAVVLLLLLATGGGLLNSRQIRSLVNDDVAHANYRTAVLAGYWVAMTTALGLYVFPRFASLTVREGVYLVVTPSIVVALLAFAYLESRAHRDA
jgi:hypothetical protein